MKIDNCYSCTQLILILVKLQASKYENIIFLADNWLNALVQDFDEVAIVNICCLAKSSYNPGFGTDPNREEEKKSFNSSLKWVFLYMQTHTNIVRHHKMLS